MIPDLKPYPAMKDSGVPWLGMVPTHWELQKLKHLTRFHNGIAFKPSDWSHSGVPIIRIQNLNGSNEFNYTMRSDLPRFLRIRSGDLLFSWSGNRGTSFGPFIWTRDFDAYLNQHIFKLDGYSLNRQYFAHLLQAVTRHIEEQSHGIIGLVHVTKTELGAVVVPVATSAEQAAIVRFLDHIDRRIRRYIRAKQKLIKLLEEQKQAIIHCAVTRGLDSNAPLKRSDFDWLGELPAHWPVLRSNRRTESFTNAIKELGYQGIKAGQLVLHSMDAFAGAIGVSDSVGKCSPEYVICEAAVDGIVLDYYANLLRSLARRGLFVMLCPSVRERAPRVRFSDFGSFVLPQPPAVEQSEIVTHISRVSRELSLVLDTSHRDLSLVREYRTRLITDVRKAVDEQSVRPSVSKKKM